MNWIIFRVNIRCSYFEETKFQETLELAWKKNYKKYKFYGHLVIQKNKNTNLIIFVAKKESEHG